ncbi:MAG: M20/M25/M40 family metallo-hydrolase [Deltaproteobacteria bacterium]|nr:M20/M25/M40 family metallo-hydrolase [Deltaproteobacteria bacterium]
MIKDQIAWQGVRDEAVEVLSAYIKINTTNPPGNEMEAARYLEGILSKEGINTTIYEPITQRANLMAVLPGEGTEAPMILLNHMDVVPVEEDKWELDPFGGIVKDGYIHGRGTIDMKGKGVAELMAMLLLKRYKIPLKRDIIFLATADEEAGGRWGVKWMLEREPRLKEAAFVLNEGGTILLRENGEVDHYEIATAQKVVSQFTLRARGRSGHGSRPHGDSANVKLIRALSRVVEWEAPFVIIPLVKKYFANLAKLKPPEEAKGYQDIEGALRDPSFAEVFTANPNYNAMVRNTFTPTILRAGNKVNVIPSEAEAVFDCRILPGTSGEDLFAQLREVIGDKEIEISSLPDFESHSLPPSPTDNELYKAIYKVAQRKDPDCMVTPFLITGATDSRFFREVGVPCYDFSPFRLIQEELKSVHGHNERISIENLGFACEVIFEIVQEVAAG